MIEYFYILLMWLVCGLIVGLIWLLTFLVISRATNLEKLSAYECGFQPFEDSRSRFEVKFYLVAILFIIFDLEIAYLFPWILCFDFINFYGLISMILFLFILTIGFIYEWWKGGLDWY